MAGEPEVRTTTPSIETNRLTLAPLRREDAAEMVAVLADAGLYAFTGGAAPTLDELEARFARWADGSPRADEAWHNWLIRRSDDGAAIGHLQATVTDRGEGGSEGERRRRSADIAWLIGAPWQGRGHATEAARALVAWLESVGVGEITAHVAPGHEASERVAVGAGLAPTTDIEDGEVVWRRLR